MRIPGGSHVLAVLVHMQAPSGSLLPQITDLQLRRAADVLAPQQHDNTSLVPTLDIHSTLYTSRLPITIHSSP